MFSLPRLWTHTGPLTLLLLPAAWLFASLVSVRRLAFRRGWLARVDVGVPVIVVGNITAGGSGKTPLVIWLTNWLREQGHRPGVVSRGYGSEARGCVELGADSTAAEVGDEPLLIHRKTGAPVVIGRDRPAAARMLRARHPEVDVIVSDDGLQHYRLERAIELAVLDAATGFGNGWPLPAGPLREPFGRLHEVDAVVQVVRGGGPWRTYLGLMTWRADYRPGYVWRLRAPAERKSLRELAQREWLAATGIGRPEGFFAMLDAHGVRHRPRAFPDHHAFRPDDLPADGAVLMTEKDAVKCADFAGPDWWAVELEVVPEAGFVEWMRARFGS